MIAFLFTFASVALAQSDLGWILSEPLETRIHELSARKPESLIFLSQLAKDSRAPLQVRWRALTTMGRWDVRYFRKDLEAALVSKEWFVRNAALIALQTDDRAHAVEWSLRLVTDPALVVRTQAVRNLIALGAREAEPQLWQQIFASRNFYGKESLWVRVHMAEALAKFVSRGHVRDFQRLLMDSDERLYPWAVLGLENTTGLRLGDKQIPIAIRRQQWLDRLGGSET